MRLLYVLGVFVFTILIGGCSTDGEELFTGKYVDEETIEFNEHKVTDQDQIDVVKEILDSGKELTKQEAPSSLSDLVFWFDHKDDSSMVLTSSIRCHYD